MRTPRPMGARGSCIRQAFHAANARFLVAPNLDDDVGRYCAEHVLPWCPGTGTGTEMIRAHRSAPP